MSEQEPEAACQVKEGVDRGSLERSRQLSLSPAPIPRSHFPSPRTTRLPRWSLRPAPYRLTSRNCGETPGYKGHNTYMQG